MKTRTMMTSLKMGNRKKLLKKSHMTKRSKMSTNQTGKVTKVATLSQTNTKLTKKVPLSVVRVQKTQINMKTWNDQKR